MTRALPRQRLRRAAIVLLLVPAGLLALAAPAAAHPLGNSSTNLASEIRVGADEVVVDHLVDLAEIRTLQLLPSVDLDDDGTVSDAEATVYATAACLDLTGDVSLRADGQNLTLTPASSSFELAAGQGGLSTARLSCRLTSPLELSGATELDFSDDSYAGRFGWREVTAVFDRTTAVSSDSPAEFANVASTTGSPRAETFAHVNEPSFVKKPEPIARVVGTARKSST